jgi:guanosine-3',5'-bis(diphosphate) 3'-pyrophosphohydrolase
MSESLALLAKAAHFAADKHRDQRRKDVKATPYINHPLSLAHILTGEGDVTDPVVICAALLHDTIEDTQTSHGELVSVFGKDIADVVLEVTDDKTLGKQARKDAQIAHAPHLSKRAKLVKLADKISNCRDVSSSPPHDWSSQRRREYFEWASAVVDAMGDVHPGLQDTFREVTREGLAAI